MRTIKRKWFILFFGLLSCCISIAQTEIDSLKKQLNKNIQDTDRVFTLHELGMAYYLSSPDSAIKFWRTAISYSEKALKIKTNKLERSVLLQAQGYSLGALAYMMQGASMQDSAALLMEKSLHNFVELGDTKGAAQVLHNLSSHYQEIANYEKAIEISNIVINLCKRTKNFKTLGFAYQNLGLAYFNYGKVSLAIEFFQKSLAVRNSIHDTIGLGHAYYELGIIYRSLKEPKEALDYFFKSLEHRTKSDDIAGVGATENEIAALYIGEFRNFEEAKKYLKDSRQHLEKINDLLRLGFLYSNYGTYYYETGNMDSALYYFSKGLEVRKSSGDRKGISLSTYLIGKIYLQEKKFDKAIENGLVAYDGGIKYKSVDLTKKAADILRLAYSGKGDWKKAYFYFEIFKRSSDSLFNAENQKLGIKSRMNFEFERVKEFLKMEEEKKRMLIAAERDKQKTRTIYRIALLILVSMFLVFIINRLRVIKNQKKIIEEQNLEVIKQKNVIEEKQKEMLDSIHYAYRIQRALLSSEKYISRNLDRLRRGTK